MSFAWTLQNQENWYSASEQFQCVVCVCSTDLSKGVSDYFLFSYCM